VAPPLPRRPDPAPGSAFRPTDWQQIYLRPRIARALGRRFAQLYYARVEDTVFRTRFLGVQTLKYPTDLWMYQELISERQPGLIVETGTWHGGSALFFATVCDALGHGEVVSIDTAPGEPLPEHPRISYVRGSSTDPAIIAHIKACAAAAGGEVLVILDSDHSRDHVLAELRAYAAIVPPGGHLVVEDTNLNGNPVLADHGPGPAEAVRAFLAEDDRYAVNERCERLLLTACPGGYLRRVR
jgi:cephalosporin hydroxylase